MTAHDRVLRLRETALGLKVKNAKPDILKAAGYAMNFVLGFAMAVPRIYGSLAPFGLGMTASSGAGISGALCLTGTIFGYLITGGFEWGIRYVATAVLIFTAAFVFQGMKISENRWFMPLTASTVSAVTSFINSFDLANNIPSAVVMLTEVLIVGSTSYFFSLALYEEERISQSDDLRHGAGVMILFACILMALEGVTLLKAVSVGRLLAVLFIMTVSMKGGTYAGCAAGTALGLAMDMAYGSGAVFTLSYAFAGLISGMFAKHGKLLFLLAYIFSNAVVTLWTWNGTLRLESLYECFCAAVLFMMIPNSFLSYIGSFVSVSSVGMGETGLRRHNAAQVEKLSGAFMDIYDTVRQSVAAPGNDGDIASVFDRAADCVCVSCKRKNICWNKNSMDTLSVMNDATKAMLSRGTLKSGDISEHFREQCTSIESFVAAVNNELRGMMYRRQFRSRLSENRTAAYGQFADIGRILKNMSDEMVNSGGADALGERRLLRYLRGIDVEADVTVFRDPSNRMHVIIESGKLASLMRDRKYLDKLSSAVGVRLCAPTPEPGMPRGRLTLIEAEPLAVSVGIAATRKKGEEVSGDRGTYFKTEQGVLCVILSDGMGSGESAARESIAAVRILERFLRAGVKPEVAMKILNSVILLKNGEEWGYTTIDLMCIDLFTGETCFYKYGAAPSYVKNGKVIRRVRGESLAAGVCAGDASAPDVVRMKLKAGSMALVMSDGMLPENEDAWIKELMAKWDGRDSKALARQALQSAVRQYGCCDDMTVLAVFVDERL